MDRGRIVKCRKPEELEKEGGPWKMAGRMVGEGREDRIERVDMQQIWRLLSFALLRAPTRAKNVCVAP